MAACMLSSTVFAQCSNLVVPGKFYDYYIVASTGSCNGNTFTSLGNNPAINDLAEVGFMAQSSAFSGTALWVGDGDMHPARTAINPGETGSSEIYDGAVQIGTSLTDVQLVSKDSITTTSPATTSIRVWNTATPDSFRYAARGGPAQQFAAVLPFPCINKNGDTAFIALDAKNPIQKYLVEVKAAGTLSKIGVVVSVGEPMIDDAGDVLLYQQTTVPSNGFQIMLYKSGLKSFTTIADYNNFTSIDSAPGISHDGMVVAFQGNLNAAGATAYATTAGPGIFAATNEGGGVWHITRVTGIQAAVPGSSDSDGVCEPGDTCQPGAELGYDDNGNAVYFDPTGYGVGTRVAVMNLGLGAAGIDDDTFVISFVGTPTGPSRENPVLKNGTPLLFSEQQGLWTIRVDVEDELSDATVRVYHPRTAIPVVQINDKIAGNVVTAIGAFDDLANAATDESGNIRTMRRGDHRVAFWASTSTGAQIVVRANHLNSTADGLLDSWKTEGIDMDQDGIVDLDLAAMGANINQRDLFLEIDWVADQPDSNYSFRLAPGVVTGAPGESIAPLIAMFLAAPPLAGNEYGVRIDGSAPEEIPAGIAVHIDGGPGFDSEGGAYSYNMGVGPLDGGGQIGLTGTSPAGLPEIIYFGQPDSLTIPGVNTRAFQDVKDNYFGSKDKDGRELAFHYSVFGDFFHAHADDEGAYSWKVADAGANFLDSASAVPSSTQDGDIVKITGGKGAGQYGAIKGLNPDNEIVMEDDWDTIPDNTSTFSILGADSGTSEVFINPMPDYNSLPGNDFMVTLGQWTVPPISDYNNVTFQSGGNTITVIGTQCKQWRTLAHELGHTMGLRHGGIDNESDKGNEYLSLMSYSWQDECDSIVQSYSGKTDLTFDDWANLQGNFSDSMIHLGNSQGLAYGTFAELNQFSPELNGLNYIAVNGPPATAPPTVVVQSPKANANVGLTLPLVVTVNATDTAKVASVTVSFDVTGSGNPQSIVAKASGANLYKANFPALSGPTGTRTITAAAIDYVGNNATVKASVNVVEPNPAPSLASLSPSSATHGGKSFTLTLTGSKFISGSQVKWNTSDLKTVFVSSGKLTATVPASDIASAGTASVTVVNPAPGGGTSGVLTFTIN